MSPNHTNIKHANASKTLHRIEDLITILLITSMDLGSFEPHGAPWTQGLKGPLGASAPKGLGGPWHPKSMSVAPSAPYATRSRMS